MKELPFDKLALAELDAVFRMGCHLTRGRQEAEDCVQETYLRAFKSAGTFQLGQFGIRPWLFKILHNVVFSRYSQGQREHRAQEEWRTEQTSSTSPFKPFEARDADERSSSDPSDWSHIDWEHVDGRLKRAIENLPLQNRIVFLMSALEGLKYREIAHIIDVPVGTVMSRLSRARAALAMELKSLPEELGLPGERSVDQRREQR